MTRILTLLSLLFLAIAHYWALVMTPPDRMMGDVYRILFVHVPAAWMCMLFFFFNFLMSLASLISKKNQMDWDLRAEATAEVGLLMNGLALILGSLWGKPTWGVWWTWDPRLTTTALMFLLYMGYLMVRKLIDESDKRRRVSGSMAILIFLNVPIVYLSVKWWRSLHQIQSSPETMDPLMVVTLRLSAIALLIVCSLMAYQRVQWGKKKRMIEEGL